MLDLNSNMNPSPEITVDDNMYNVKCRQPDILHELVFFEPIRKIRVSHEMFKVESFTDVGPYVKLLQSFENYINSLKEQMTDIETNPSHKFMKSYISKVLDQVPTTM